jgi:OPT family small oligopeptide transporter
MVRRSNNITLDAVTGVVGGLGLNPWPSFDWNMFTGLGLSGLYLPTFAIANQIVGILVAALAILGIWFSNAWQTGYLPINSNGSFDNAGSRYNVSKVLNSRGLFDEDLYQKYSQPWFSAGYIVYNMACFASYSASLAYVYLFYRQTIVRGFQAIWRQVLGKTEETDIEEDVHYRLMRSYKEVPDWHYLTLLVVPIFFGVAAVKAWPTEAGVGALFYGLILPIIFVLPVGIIQAVTGIPVALNTLAAIVGGFINAGNPNGLIFFKCWAYLSSYQALGFVGDLKMAHYTKVPPRVAFWCQIVATVILAVVSSLQFNFIMDIKDVCTKHAPFRFTCPLQNGFFTITIFWGVISPKKLFGNGQRYNMMLLGFPIGFLIVFLYWLLVKRYPRSSFIRQIHPVMLTMGPVSVGAPYNLAFHLPNLYINLLSFMYIRKRYLAFWSKVSPQLIVTNGLGLWLTCTDRSGIMSSVRPSLAASPSLP